MLPEKLLKEFKLRWGDAFDYSDADYHSNKEKIHIRCKKHNLWFLVTPEMHLRVRGCPGCENERKTNQAKLINDNFIRKCKEIYGDRFTYEKTNYSVSSKTIIVTCKKHGEVKVSVKYLLSGKGCPKCNQKPNHKGHIQPWEDCLSDFRSVHGYKYIYDKATYNGNVNKMKIICPKHGEFWQSPSKHKTGRGCPKCAMEGVKGHSRYTIDEYKERVSAVHKNKYDYSMVDFRTMNDIITIICHEKDENGVEHGAFQQRCSVHANGCGCPKCAKKVRTTKSTKGFEDFIQEAKKVHKDDNYDYSMVKYVNRNTPIIIKCHKHGEFIQKPLHHLRGHGCPICGMNSSNGENDIVTFLKSLGICGEIIERDRKLLVKREVDILLPKYKLGIEYNGLFWHSEINGKFKRYHLEKEELMLDKGYSLIQIFEDEYVNKKDVVLSIIKRILDYNNDFEYVSKSDCIVREAAHKEMSIFLNNNDILGECKSTLHIGCFFNGKIVCGMSFLKSRNDNEEWIIIRSCMDIGIMNDEMYEMIFDYFVKKYRPKTVYAYADRRFELDNNSSIYNKIGLSFCGSTSPEYTYYKNKFSKTKRIKRTELRRNILEKKYGFTIPEDKGSLETILDFSKVWDCGKYKYVWNNNDLKI